MRWAVVLALVGALSLILTGQDNGTELNPVEQRLIDLRAELDLSRLRLEASFDSNDVPSEERRSVLAQWRETHAAEIAEQRRLLTQLRPVESVPTESALVPEFEGLGDEQIEAEIGAYLSHEQRRLRGDPQTPAEREAAHDRVGRWMESETVAELRAAQIKAAARIQEAEMERLRAEARPYTEEELGQFAGAQLIEAEIYNLMLAAQGEEALADGEELRDRYGSVEAELDALRADLRRIAAAERQRWRINRINELEQHLNP